MSANVFLRTVVIVVVISAAFAVILSVQPFFPYVVCVFVLMTLVGPNREKKKLKTFINKQNELLWLIG